MEKSSLQNVNKKNILVIGDVMLDSYFNGEVKRISPEAPVPVFRKTSEHSVLGGAANVAANLIAAGQKVTIMSIIGKDLYGNILQNKFKSLGIESEMLILSERNTTVKTRFLAANNQQVLRLDIEDTNELTDNECELLLCKLKKTINHFNIVLLSDYNKGLLTYNFTQGVIQLAQTYGIPVIIDVKDKNIGKYKNAYLLKPNLKELRDLTSINANTEDEIISASNKLRKKCNCKYVLTTCGAKGMVLVGEDTLYYIPAVNQEVFDVTGAGDTTIAYLAACMANGISMKKSLEIANYAAGLQVRKVGTSVVYWKEIKEFLMNQSESTTDKIINQSTIHNFRTDHPAQKIVFTNGCFDILHIGHIRYLQEAAKLGDVLIVGLNSDKSVRKLKGCARPVNSQEERAELLSALKFVDYVIIFDEDTPYELIKKLQPDVLVKGGDYHHDNVVGADLVEAKGGKLVLIPFVNGKSTTSIIEKLKNDNKSYNK